MAGPDVMRRLTPGQGRLAQARRAVQEDVVQGFLAQFGRLDENFQIVFDLILTNIFA